ncbi:subclass B3 metallo-beta-lactamase [Phenylobacterium sp.]|uniref:subclass B3 metallo-beta-lactamase n=1 Tax=Phenylobacterium sp. TaxID=1871053 RepID=UPI00271FEDE9|nr:subclass B3 metallo-beta-lactamase [Phenylobacterium sp.]MDO8802547.1 subclass B3 metallo-beta-lactamase [Phenylobacterium sp.]
MKTPILAAALALTAAPAFAQANWLLPAKPYRVIDNTYSVGSAGLTALLIVTPKGAVLLDAGMPQYAGMVEKNVQALGFKLSDIKILLTSHGHFDHAGGLARIKADTGAAMIAAEGDRYALEKGVYPGSESNKLMNFPPVKVDRVVKDGETVELGGLKLTAHLTPGHTAGCTTWTWPVKDKDGAAHTALYFCSASVAANSLVPEQYPGIVADYRHTFATARAIPGDVFLAPHSEFFDAPAKKARLGQPGPNPFIDRAGYLKVIDAQQKAFEASLAKAQAKAGK